MLENIALAVISLGALYYLYQKLVKNRGCGCGKSDCCEKK
jgi:hypothetical protein